MLPRADHLRAGHAFRATHQPQRSSEPVEPPRRYRVRAEVSPTSERDCGIVIDGVFEISEGLIRVYDMSGRLLGSSPFRPGDNAELALRGAFTEPLKRSDLAVAEPVGWRGGLANAIPSWVAHGFAETLTRAFLYLLLGRSRALERGAAPIGARHLAGGDPCD